MATGRRSPISKKSVDYIRSHLGRPQTDRQALSFPPTPSTIRHVYLPMALLLTTVVGGFTGLFILLSLLGRELQMPRSWLQLSIALCVSGASFALVTQLSPQLWRSAAIKAAPFLWIAYLLSTLIETFDLLIITALILATLGAVAAAQSTTFSSSYNRKTSLYDLFFASLLPIISISCFFAAYLVATQQFNITPNSNQRYLFISLVFILFILFRLRPSDDYGKKVV